VLDHANERIIAYNESISYEDFLSENFQERSIFSTYKKNIHKSIEESVKYLSTSDFKMKKNGYYASSTANYKNLLKEEDHLLLKVLSDYKEGCPFLYNYENGTYYGANRAASNFIEKHNLKEGGLSNFFLKGGTNRFDFLFENNKKLLNIIKNSGCNFMKFHSAFLSKSSLQYRSNYINKIIEKYKENRDQISYNHETHSLQVIGKEGGENELNLNDITTLYNVLTNTSHLDFSKNQVTELFTPFNSTEESSRKQINDYLVQELIDNTGLREYQEGDTELNVKFNDIARSSLANWIDPEKTAEIKTIDISPHNSNNSTGSLQKGLVCAGSTHSKLYYLEEGKKTIVNQHQIEDEKVPYFSIHAININEIKNISPSKKIIFECDGKKYEVNHAFENGKISSFSIDEIKNFKFNATENKEITAVSTFGFIDEMRPALEKGMILALKHKGFTLESKEKAFEPSKEKLFQDLKNTDIYFPGDHALNLNSFTIGDKNSNRYLFTKKNKTTGVKTSLILYLPNSENQGESHETQDISTEEMTQVLNKRKNVNNLFVLNVSCNSKNAVSQWMHAYYKTEEINLSNNEQRCAPPIVIGADRSFSTSTAQQILKVLEFPLGTLTLAGQDATLDEITNFLEGKPALNGTLQSSSSFKPVSNFETSFEYTDDTKINSIPLILTDENNNELRH